MTTTFNINADDHHSFKGNCHMRKTDMTTEINGFIKRFNNGQESANEELLKLTQDILFHAEKGGLKVNQYTERLKAITL